jgi:hypothetical protein
VTLQSQIPLFRKKAAAFAFFMLRYALAMKNEIPARSNSIDSARQAEGFIY